VRRIPRYVTPQNELELLQKPEKPWGGESEKEFRTFEIVENHDLGGCLPRLLSRLSHRALVFEHLDGVRMVETMAVVENTQRPGNNRSGRNRGGHLDGAPILFSSSPTVEPPRKAGSGGRYDSRSIPALH